MGLTVRYSGDASAVDVSQALGLPRGTVVLRSGGPAVPITAEQERPLRDLAERLATPGRLSATALSRLSLMRQTQEEDLNHRFEFSVEPDPPTPGQAAPAIAPSNGHGKR